MSCALLLYTTGVLPRGLGSDPTVDRSIRGEVAGLGGWGSLFSGRTIELDGMWITASVARVGPSVVSIRGTRGGRFVGEETIVLEPGEPVWFAPGWPEVDDVAVLADVSYVAVDDILYDAGPDVDSDGDGVDDRADLCPAVFEAEQTDSDGDFVGDACDPDGAPVAEVDTAEPMVIDFEALDPGGPADWLEVPAGYDGFDWAHAYAWTADSGLGVTEEGLPLSHGRVGVMAGRGYTVTLERDGFALDGFFAGNDRDETTYVVVEGQRDGEVVGRTWAEAGSGGLTYVPVGWTDLDRVVFSSWPSEVLVDDIIINSGPDAYLALVDEDEGAPPDAAVLDFEDVALTGTEGWLDGYGGMSWVWFGWVERSWSPVPLHGDDAVDVQAGSLRGFDIELDGFRASSAWGVTATCAVEGQRDGEVVEATTIVVQPGAMQWFSFEWTGLSAVNLDCGGRDVVLDDVVVNAGPDLDTDGDGVFDRGDNCPAVANPDQADADTDYEGDACDVDVDDDGVADAVDLCPDVPDAAQGDGDGDGIGDACDEDRDNDGALNDADLCPDLAGEHPYDSDQDGVGDDCDGVDGVLLDFEEQYPGYEIGQWLSGGVYIGGTFADVSQGFYPDAYLVSSGFYPNTGHAYGVDGTMALATEEDEGCACGGLGSDVPFDLNGLRLASTWAPYQQVWLVAWNEVGEEQDVALVARNDRAEVYDLDLKGIIVFLLFSSQGEVTFDDVRINEGWSDLDGDGVYNDPDLCADTVSGAAVDADGCSGAQEVALACPADRAWPSHVAYARCVGTAANAAQRKGLLTSAERMALVSAVVGPRR